MKKIVILGATGFIGRHLKQQLDAQKYQITFCSRHKQKDYQVCDITDSQRLKKILKGQDLVINLVAPDTQIDSPKASAINQKVIIEGTKNLIHAAKENKIKKIIHLSSIAGYRQNRGPYGEAKRQADEFLLVSGLNVILLKPTLIYGKDGYIFDKLLKTVKKFPFFVPIIGNGQNLIQPVFVEDVVACIVSAVEKDFHGVHEYELGGPHTTKYDTFIKEILKILGKKKILIHLPLVPLLFTTRFLSLFSDRRGET